MTSKPSMKKVVSIEENTCILHQVMYNDEEIQWSWEIYVCFDLKKKIKVPQ